MNKTNRHAEIIRRMTEIEELKANGDLTVRQDEELGWEYCQLEEELENLEADGPSKSEIKNGS